MVKKSEDEVVETAEQPQETTPFHAKIVPAPAEEEAAAAAEPVKVPRGKTAFVFNGADAAILSDGRRVGRGDTVIASGEEAEALVALGGFTEQTAGEED